MKFKDLFNEFLNVKRATIKQSTIDLYIRIYDHHFHFFDDMNIEKFSTSTVDDWLLYLKYKNKNEMRFSFDHELSLLKNIVNHYNEFYDGNLDIFKKRHFLKSKLKKKDKIKKKEFKDSEFNLFRTQLALFYGKEIEMLAVIQYYQALRISEAIAIHYDDIHLDLNNPLNSYLVINKSVVFTHSSKKKSYLQKGFKNGLIKTQPILPEVYNLLKDQIENYKGQFLFIQDGIPEFYAIQNKYNRTFKAVGLPYRSTHILRHGGCSRIFNFSGGNVLIASQLLGNSQEETIKTYAHIYQNSLQNFTNSLYSKG